MIDRNLTPSNQTPAESRETHVLVVDDDPQIRMLLARLLRVSGYRVIGAGDGDQMKQVLASTAIDLIVRDVMLPGTSGFDLCRELRKDSLVPIIMLTARGEESDRIAGLDIGADDYLSKPFSPRELIARINAIMRRMRVGGLEADRVKAPQIISIRLVGMDEASVLGKEL